MAFKHLYKIPLISLFAFALTCCNSDDITVEEPPPYITPDELAPDLLSDPDLPAHDSADWDAAVAAARFLAQTTFGVTAKDINLILKNGRQTWFDRQLATPQSLQLKLLDKRLALFGYDPDGDDVEPHLWHRMIMRSDIWWETAIWGQDQLRQRVTFALSQILVVSNTGANTYARERGFAQYHDILARHALGNYGDLLVEISTHPLMGVYLSFLNNPKADPENGIRPDENYAREILQLFSIGLEELNIDGSPKLNNAGERIATYDQQMVKEFARIFTGWSLGDNKRFAQTGVYSNQRTNVLPLKAFPEAHDSDAKTLLNNELIPAGNTPIVDIQQAAANIMKHDNVGPFIGKKLIQYLVTSNPSPAYISRVASAFNDNGAGVKGDMNAVIKAIYLDDEATNPPLSDAHYFGKPREFPIMVAGIWRAFNAQGIQVKSDTSNVNTIRYMNHELNEEQGAFFAPSVFNYYQSNFSPPGLLSQKNILAPEFQILNQGAAVAQANLLANMIFNRHKDDPDLFTGTGQNWGTSLPWNNPPVKAILNLDDEIALANDPTRLVDRLNLLLAQGYIDAEDSQSIARHISLLSDPLDRVYEAAFLIAISPEYAVQR